MVSASSGASTLQDTENPATTRTAVAKIIFIGIFSSYVSLNISQSLYWPELKHASFFHGTKSEPSAGHVG